MGISDFYDVPLRREKIPFEGGFIWAPVWIHSSQSFTSMHTASYEAVAAELPSEAILPLRWTGGRTLVQVAANRYEAVTWAGADGTRGLVTPYGEVLIAAVVTEGPAPRVLPLLRGRAGAFMLHTPVTTHEALAGGRDFFGWPKFLADMDFTETGTSRSLVVSDQGQHLLTLTVHPAGRPKASRANRRVYTVFRGELLRTVVPHWSIAQTRRGPGGAMLELGDHPVADQLRRLDLSATPVFSISVAQGRMVMPMPGPAIGPARDCPAYEGSDAATARYTVTYPHGPAIDQYQPLPHPA